MACESQTNCEETSELSLTETFDANVMNRLLQHQGISEGDKKRLRSYYKMRKNGNQVTVSYEFGKAHKKSKIGRLYPRNLIGFAGFERNIRNALIKNSYHDIDIKNCHPSILVQVCERHGWRCDNLKYYTENREQVFKTICEFYDTNKDVAKQLFIIISFGGTIKTWFLENQSNICDTNRLITHPFIEAFQRDIQAIAKNLWNNDATAIIRKDILKACKKHFKTDYEMYASCMALFLQNEERKIILDVKKTLESHGRSVDSLIYDGCLIKKLPEDDMEPQNIDVILKTAETYVKETLGYVIKLVSKPIETNIYFEERCYVDSNIIIDDVYAASQFVKIMNKKIVFCEGILYVFNEESGLWTNDNAVIRRYINNHNEELKFKQMNEENGKIQVFNYSGKEVNIINMLKNCGIFCQNNCFFTEKLRSSKGKLLFQNGIYDFKSDTFTEGFDAEIVFFGRISRPYNPNVNDEIVKNVDKILFRDPFYEEDFECADYFKIGLARGMAWDYEAKKSYFGIGDSNAGKGVLTDAFTSAFGDYIGVFNSSALSYNPACTSDMAKQMSWVIDIAKKRIAIANECRASKALDSKIYKELVSGGDPILARKNRQDEITVYCYATLLVLANDIAQFNPPDDSIKNRVNYIDYKRTFHDPDTYQGNTNDPEFRAADKTLREKFQKDNDYKDAVVILIRQAYQHFLAQGHKMPKKVFDSSQEWSGVQVTFKQRIQKYVEFTGLGTDYVTTDYIINCIRGSQNENLDMTPTKIGIEMKKILNASSEQKEVNGRNTRVYYGVKEIKKWKGNNNDDLDDI
jgi:hypothetical protein